MEIFIPNGTNIKFPFGIVFAVEARVEVKIDGEVSLTKLEIKGKIIGYPVDKPIGAMKQDPMVTILTMGFCGQSWDGFVFVDAGFPTGSPCFIR